MEYEKAACALVHRPLREAKAAYQSNNQSVDQ